MKHVLPFYLASALTLSWGQAENAIGTDRCTVPALLLNVPSTTSVSKLTVTAKILPGIMYLGLTLKKTSFNIVTFKK